MIEKEEMKKMVHDAVGAYFSSPGKLHHEIYRLREQNEKILDGMRDTIKERDILSGENYDLRAENERLRKENERLEDTRIEFIGMINKLIDERVKMRKALNPFAATAKHFKDDCKDTLVVKIGVDVGYLRAAAAAIRDSGDE